jgi:hypothetical protein
MREIKKFISVDNKEFDTEKECADYEQKMLDYINSNLVFTECSSCQYHALCNYLFEKKICYVSLCDFIKEKTMGEFNK